MPVGDFLNSNEWQWRLARTIAQGVASVVVANLDLILGVVVVEPQVRSLLVALVMAVLSPVKAEFGGCAMSSSQEMVCDWALSQVGYVPSSGKFNKYAEYLDRTNIYNGPKNGYDWCDVFADCDYVSNFGLDVAVRMIAQPLRGCGAGCAFSASYYRAADQWDRDPSVGAQIFFGRRGAEHHTSIVVGCDSAHIFTVEGNTGYSAGYMAVRC